MASIANLVVSLGAKIDDFESDLQRAGRISEREMKKLEKQAQRLNDEYNKKFKQAGLAVAAGLGFATKSAIDFERAMAEVSTLLDDVSGLDRTADAVKDLAIQYGQMPVGQVKALYQIISAGATDSAEQIEVLTAANELAVGGMTDVATAADGLTSVLNAYEATGLTAQQASDILFATMRLGKTTIEELSASVGSVASIAAQTGVRFEELGAAVAVMTGAGLSTSQAMEGLRGVLSAVLKQTDKTRGAAEALGIQFDVDRLKAVGFAGVLQDIANSNATEEQLSALIGRVEGLSAFMAAARNNGDAFADALEKTANSAGAAGKAVEKAMDTTGFRVDQAKAAFERLRIEIGTKFLSTVSGAAVAFVTHFEAVIRVVESLVVLLTVRLGIAGLAALTKVTAGAGLLANAMAFLGGPIGAVALAFTGLLLAIDNYIEKQSRIFQHLEVNNALLLKQAEAYRAVGEAAKAAALAQDIAEKYKQLSAEIAATEKELKRLSDLYETSVAISGKHSAATKKFADQIEELNIHLKNARKVHEAYGKELDKVEKTTVEAAEATGKMTKAAQEFKEEADAMTLASEELNDPLEDTLEFLKAIRDEMDPLGAEARRTRDRIIDLDIALEEGVITGEEYDRILSHIIEQHARLGASAGKAAEDFDLMREALLEGVRILERAFTDMWQNILTGAGGVFDSIVDAFGRMLSNMLHQMTTAPIIKELQNLLSGKNFNLGNLLGGLATAAGTLIGFELGGGGVGAGIGSSLGSILGQALGSTLGKTIGGLLGSAAGPIGSLLGSIAGGLIGGLFDKKPKLELGGSLFDSDALRFESALGGFFLDERKLDAEAVGQIADAVQQFDAAIAGIVSDDQLGKITEALDSWYIKLKDDAITIDAVLNSRFAAILGTFAQEIQDFVNKAHDLEGQVARLEVAAAVEKLFAEVPELFGDRTVRDFLNIVDAFQEGTETITDAFVRLVAELDVIDSAMRALADFAGSNLEADFQAILDAASETLTETVTRLNVLLSDAIANFDGSPAQLSEIALLVTSVREGEIALLQQIDDIQKGINANLDQLRKDLLGIVEPPKSTEELLADAQALIGAVAAAGTPEAISEIAAQFESIIRSIDTEGAPGLAEQLVSLVDQFQTQANAALELAKQSALDAAESMRLLVDDFMDTLGTPLDLLVASNERIARALEGDPETGQPGDLPGIPGIPFPGFNLIPQAVRDVGFETAEANREALEGGAILIRDAIATQLSTLPAAIRAGFQGANIEVNVVLPESGIATE